MKKAFVALFSILPLCVLSSCKTTSDYDAVYEKVNDLCENYECTDISYSSVLKNEEYNISLTNTGSILYADGIYTYSYSYQYLNKIGSGADSLISTSTGTIKGTRDEVTTEGFQVDDSIYVTGIDLKDSFKVHNFTETSDSYVMSGYLARNTILKNTDHLDDDIRFNYELTVNKDITEIKKLVISYVTVRFDSIVITITYGGGSHEN